ncbi:MAG TPA: 50S ribosomal protein L11 methyltransferase [Thermodesulfobacteriota bacterium]|nr:50S ribosomal protein L11 methyltransferase [Thermodesulfobacteriota bacterium]
MLKLSQLRLRVSENTVPLFSDFLLGLGSLGVAEDIKEDGMYELSAYFPMDTDLSSVMESLREQSGVIKENVEGARIGPVEVEHIDRSSWEVWKTVLTMVRAGEGVVIVPPWEKYAPSPGETVVEINPSLAFGTGHHETTRLCIAFIEESARSGGVKSMLDVGCGSGILSISAYKLGIPDVTGFDTDPVAISESMKNARRNGVLGRIKFFCGHLESVRGAYDLIVANVYLEPIYHMREGLKSRLAPGGSLVVSGIPVMRRDDAVKYLVGAGYRLDKETREGEWVALRFRTD